MRFFFMRLSYFILVLFILILSPYLQAATFAEKQISPVVEKITDSTSLEILLAGSLTTLLVRPYDDQIRSEWRDHQKMSEDQARAGDLLGSGVPGILIAGSQYFFDSNENHFQSHVRGLIYSTLVNSGLKFIINRPRPNDKDRLSFPSGHSMTSFLTATSLTYGYGWKAGLIAYPVAVYVGLSRLADDAHWGSDVVGGAVIGILMARACFYELNAAQATANLNEPSAHQSIEPSAQSAQLQFFPNFQPASSGIELVYSF